MKHARGYELSIHHSNVSGASGVYCPGDGNEREPRLIFPCASSASGRWAWLAARAALPSVYVNRGLSPGGA